MPYSTGMLTEGPGILGRFWQGLGLPSKLKYKKMILKNAGLRLYLCCVELVDHDQFSKEFALPDTFNTWFRITELHIWMCMVRLAREGKEGMFVRNKLMQFMWLDVDKRTRKLGDGTSFTSRREGILNIGAHFKATLFAYDEGLLSDDTVLAGALWRNFFEMDCKDVTHLENLVHYVRKQLQYLELQDSSSVIKDGLIKFLPLHGDEENVKRTKPILTEIYRRV